MEKEKVKKKKRSKQSSEYYTQMPKEICDRIKKLRKEQNKTQLEFASEIHVAQNSVSQTEKGLRALTLENLITYAKYFNTSCDYICLGSENLSTLDILTKYIRLDFVSFSDYDVTYPVLKINSTLIDYLFRVEGIESIVSGTSSEKQENIQKLVTKFYKMENDSNYTASELSIPLTKEVIFPDEYQKEWSKIIALRSLYSTPKPKDY